MGSRWIVPDWPAPPSVWACTTTRLGGHSRPPYDSLNLSDDKGDDVKHVALNRQELAAALKLPSEPHWLKQVHGTTVLTLTPQVLPSYVADGAYTAYKGTVCAVLTADCLPVLLCDMNGREVAALHAGWRGLAAGIIEQGVRTMASPAENLLAWLGPAIGPSAFEVGDEVRAVFVALRDNFAAAFTPVAPGKWLMNIYAIARAKLKELGVTAIYGGDACTYSDATRFFSYRRDGEKSGRMATLIWRE